MPEKVQHPAWLAKGSKVVIDTVVSAGEYTPFLGLVTGQNDSSVTVRYGAGISRAFRPRGDGSGEYLPSRPSSLVLLPPTHKRAVQFFKETEIDKVLWLIDYRLSSFDAVPSVAEATVLTGLTERLRDLAIDYWAAKEES